MRSMQRKAVLTTGQVARICHVAPRTVSKWFDSGELEGYRIPGSRDRRIPIERLIEFMRKYDIPIDPGETSIHRILLVDANPRTLETSADALNKTGAYQVRTASNGFEAGLMAQEFRPHAIVLDIDENPQEAFDTCRKIKNIETLGVVSVIAAGAEMTDRKRRLLRTKAFDACIAKPYSLRQLRETLEEATGLLI